MGLVVTQEGSSLLWRWMLDTTPPMVTPYPSCHLIGSPFDPAFPHAVTYGQLLTVELTVGGYAPILLNNPSGNWSLSYTGNGTLATHTVVNWSLAVACLIYGYWLDGSTMPNPTSWWFEVFPTPWHYDPGAGPFLLALGPTLTSVP